MKNFYFLMFVFVQLLSINILNAQCAQATSNFANHIAPTSTTFSNTTTCHYGGEYANISNCIAGADYEYTTCGDADFDTQLTVRDGFGGGVLAYNDDACGVQSTVSWTQPTNGTAVISLHLFNCASNTTCMTLQNRRICAPGGNPATFGSNSWNVYGYNHGGYNFANQMNLTGVLYRGFYNDGNLDITSTNRWATTPSSASGWDGCVVTDDNHTVVYKRQGFPCGVYEIDLDDHDDGVRCYVDGAQVYQIDGCCADRGVIYTGYLGATSTVEFRVSEGGGGSNLFVDFDLLTPGGTSNPTLFTNVNDICSGATNGEIEVKNSLHHDYNFTTIPSGIILYQNAIYTSNRIQLTPAVNSQQGVAVISNTGHNATSFRSSFNITNVGADGYCFSYGNNLNGSAAALPANTNLESIGIGTGLTIGFSYYSNNIVLRYNGTNIRSISYVLNTNYAVVITVDEVGRATLTLNGTAVFTNVFISKAYYQANKSNWDFAFGGRTGGVNGIHSIDNLFIGEYEYSKDGSIWQNSPIFGGLATGLTTIQKRLLLDVCGTSTSTIGSKTISDTPSSLQATAISPTCVGGSDGSIDLSISGAINGARVVKIIQLDNEPFNTNEIQAFEVGTNTNVALASLGGIPTQSSNNNAVAYPTIWLNDGNTNNGIGAHTLTGIGEWQRVSWDEPITLDRIVIWNRSDCCNARLDNIRIDIFGDLAETNLLYSISNVDADNGTGTSFTLNLDGGDFNPINTYAWSNSATTEDITGLSADSYDVTVTDAYGCVSSLTGITVSEPANHNLTAVVTNEVCPSDNNGSLDLTINSPRISAEPSAFSDLALWTKGDAGVVKNKDGDVIQWQDISGNDNHFYTNFGSNVQEVSSSIGAKPAIRFNANEIMETQTSFNSNPYTMIVVGKLNGTNQRLISSGSKNWLFGWWGGSKDRMFAEGWVHQGSSAGITNNYIYSVTGSGTGIVGSGTSFWSNGTQLTTLGTDGRQAPGIISLGGWGTGNSERSSGDVSEVIYYNKALSSNERMALEKYLADKYGISISHSGVNPTVSWSPGGATTEDLTGLDAGSYTVTVTDVAGCTTDATFNVGTDKTESTAPTTASASVNIFCAGEPVTLTVGGGSLGTNATWVWYDDAALTNVVASGTATSTTILPSSTTKYYVRAVGDCNTTAADSTDLVVANAFSTTPNSQVALANSTSSSSCGVNGVNWHYFYNESGELLASINPNGQNLGYTTVTITVGDNGPFGQGLAPGVCGYNGANGGEYAMPRYWDITVENQPIIPGNSVDVRFYYTNADVVSLVSITGAQNQNYKDCWGEVTGESDLMMTIDHGSSSEPISISPTAASFGGSLRQIEFPMTEFSGGKLHSNGGLNPGNALPVELISFKAETVNEEAIKLDWTTATEINNEGFEVQRSTNGMSFEKIAWVAGNGNTNKNIDYALVDKDVETGILYYYRLMQIDFDGAFEYSKVVSASLTNLDLIEVSYFIPNPSSNATKLVFEGNRDVQVQIEIMDNIGRKVASKVQTIESGKNTITFDLNEFSNGVYTARIIMDKEEFTRKLVVRK